MPLVPGDTGSGQGSPRRSAGSTCTGWWAGAPRAGSGPDWSFASSESLSLSGASADVQVVVSNDGVGHAAPGGPSSKSLVLAVELETASGELMHRRERVYRREMRTPRGAPWSRFPTSS